MQRSFFALPMANSLVCYHVLREFVRPSSRHEPTRLRRTRACTSHGQDRVMPVSPWRRPLHAEAHQSAVRRRIRPIVALRFGWSRMPARAPPLPQENDDSVHSCHRQCFLRSRLVTGTTYLPSSWWRIMKISLYRFLWTLSAKSHRVRIPADNYLSPPGYDRW